MKKLILIALLGVSSGCELRIMNHSPESAAKVADGVLGDVYFRAAYQKAFQEIAPHVRDSTSEFDLRKLAESLSDSLGELIELQVESFEPVPGRDAILLYYTGVNERGLSYHRVLLRGDERTYKVAGLFWSGEPFSSSRHRHKIDNGTVIRPSDVRRAPVRDPHEFQWGGVATKEVWMDA